jgi:hypothetical protein
VDTNYRGFKDLEGRVESEVIDFTKSLIEIPNLSLNEGEIASVIEKKMIELEYDEVFIDSGGNVIGLVYGSNPGGSVLLTSHMDLTEDTSYRNLKAPFHGPELKDRQLFGTGIANCKAGLAAQVYAAALLKRSQVSLYGGLIVAATVADEGGLCLGIHSLLRDTLPVMGTWPSFAVLSDPTELAIYNCSDGWVQLDIDISGPQMKPIKDAAFEVIRIFQRDTDSLDYGQLGDFLPIPKPRFWSDGKESHTCISLVRGLSGDDDIEMILQRIRNQLETLGKQVPEVEFEVDIHTMDQQLYNGRTVTANYLSLPWKTDPDFYGLRSICTAFEKEGFHYRLDGWHNRRLNLGSAGSVLVNEFGIPTIGYGPGSESIAHTAHEYVEVDKIIRAVYGNAVIGLTIAGDPDTARDNSPIIGELTARV